MNIVIVGPGSDPKRFGTHFVNKSEANGHSVTKFSYRLYDESPDQITERFENTIANLDKIDLFLYNVMGGTYPGEEHHFKTSHIVAHEEWKNDIVINASLPHAFSLKCLEKMNENSSIVFMTSSASYLINRSNYLSFAGYFGTKATMNHLARSLAEYNDKQAKVCVMGPHIPYEDAESAEVIMESLSERILNISKEDNGKILQCYPPHGNIFYHEGGKNP